MSAFHPAIVERFHLLGEVVPLSAMHKAVGAPARPARRLGGWLMTYGKIGADGGIVPTVDRDGHTVEAARELGHIDWSPYIKGGRWNDTHDEGVIVGLPETLEFHDVTTELAKAHGKVGFWTTGRLFDRADPSSWEGLTDTDGRARRPTAHELDRADAFWDLAHLLKGTPRPIGLSAHGQMALSPCRRRILYAIVEQAAVCELPKNPDATLEPMEMGRRSPLEFLRKGMATNDPCGRCTCPPGACANLRKAGVTTGTLGAAVPQDLEGAHTDDTAARVRELVKLVMDRYFLDEATAKRWIVQYYVRAAQTAPEEPRHVD